MTQSANINRRIVLASRPQGLLGSEHFRTERLPVPEPGPGQILLRTAYLSVDPYMRGRMDQARSYARPVDIGAVMVGGTVSRVLRSRNSRYQEGELLLAHNGWQDYAVMDDVDLLKLDAGMARPTLALSVLGLPGFTAWIGLHDIGQPKAGETLVVGAATGAVGSVVGQLAKMRGCRTVGIAGGAAKCDYAVQELGFDACVNHREGHLLLQLREACPDGIDIYFENLGGRALHAVMPQLNVGARIPVCGLMSYYNQAAPAGQDYAPLIMSSLLVKRARMQGFLFDDHFEHYGARFMQFFEEMSALIASGQLRCREDFMDGLEAAPGALMGLLRGDNFGKVVIRVGPE